MASSSPPAVSTPTSTSGTATNSSRASPTLSTSVICQEVFDETCQPSADEIRDYAALLGIDPDREPHLLYLAKEGLMQALPVDWKICFSEEKNGHYYYNTKTKQSQWDHPLDSVYRELVLQARQRNSGATTATPIIDNSDDASQLDSGIRSLQGTDDCDNTNNTTNEISSPISNANANGAISKCSGVSMNGLATNCNIAGATSGFSGGVSRFLESRGKNFGMNFQPVKNSRFEVAKTSLQIGLAMKFSGDPFGLNSAAVTTNRSTNNSENGEVKKGFTLSGTGAMFLKSRRQSPNNATTMMTPSPSSNIIIEGIVGTPPGVKSILRDSSLTDMRRRLEKEKEWTDQVTSAEDKKSVRFNLDDSRMRCSPEEDQSSSRRLTQSPDVSINSDEDNDNDDDDNNPWDEEDDPNGCVGYCSLPMDSNYERSLNPFLANNPKQLTEMRDSKITSNSHPTPMLKAQSFSIDLPEDDKIKGNELQRSHSVEVSGPNIKVANTGSSYLEKIKDNSAVKPLYEDTDSDSKGSSVRSFIINKSEQDSMNSTATFNNPFDLDELNRRHSKDVEQLEKKLNTPRSEKRLLKATAINESLVSDYTELKDEDTVRLVHELEKEKKDVLNAERERLEELLQLEIDNIKCEHELKLKNIRHEYELRLASHQHELDEKFELQLDEHRVRLEEELDARRKLVIEDHKAHMATLQQNHLEILQDLERDLKSEEEIIKKEHAVRLNEMRDKVMHELEIERNRLRDSGDDRMYEKVRCEKRLLEDKYRCLKEKYVRLKTDVKLSLERRNKRREAQALQQQGAHGAAGTLGNTGSETEKPSVGNSENRSLTLSISYQERGSHGTATCSTATAGNPKLPPAPAIAKPPVPPKTHLSASVAKELQQRDKPAEVLHSQQSGARKPGIASKYIKHLQVKDESTSVSHSDNTISNNYTRGRYLPAPPVSDNGNSDSEAFQSNQENNNNARTNVQRKKAFSRTKSASTSRLNSDNYRSDRPCTPVENLRHQLQKLEDLEDQFPDNTLDATYHLRYPFSDISNEQAGASSELEFFKHRIHLERDSVRRAKESLRMQRTNFRTRQREIKQRHKMTLTRHTLDQLIHEEKELTEMEVNLHRTRALLGEKVIRLRHLEQSLLRIYEKEKPAIEFLGVEGKDDATLSDLSSHSSSGFSSTDFGSGGDTQNLHKRKDIIYHQESSECVQNLEILNAEIREILDILGKSQSQAQPQPHQPQHQQQHSAMSVPMFSPSELNWSQMLTTGPMPSTTGSAANLLHAPQSIPTLADRLETYRQLASGRMHSSILAANTIVSQSPRALNYTTSLVERTRDLRNWLRQARSEHEILSSMAVQQVHTLVGNNTGSGAVGPGPESVSGIGSGSGSSSNTTLAGAMGGTSAQANL